MIYATDEDTYLRRLHTQEYREGYEYAVKHAGEDTDIDAANPYMPWTTMASAWSEGCIAGLNTPDVDYVTHLRSECTLYGELMVLIDDIADVA